MATTQVRPQVVTATTITTITTITIIITIITRIHFSGTVHHYVPVPGSTNQPVTENVGKVNLLCPRGSQALV